MAVVCPSCSLILQTLDLPCPVCATSPMSVEADAWTLHEYSKTFHNHRRYVPEPDALIAELNYWMATQPGLVGVAPIIHRNGQGAVKGVTLTCTASSRLAPRIFRFDRIKLASSLGFKHRDLGPVLNEWHDAHPEFDRVQHFMIAGADGLAECWVLSFGPRSSESLGRDPGSAPPLRLSPAVRIPATALLWIAVLVIVGAPLQTTMGTLGSWLSVVVASAVSAAVWLLVERRAAQLGSKPSTSQNVGAHSQSIPNN